MTIRRAPHQAEYVVIHNDALRDPTLSFKARGILALLLSMPDTWRVNGRWLAEQGPDGKASTWAGLKELESANYLRRRRYHGPDGRWHHESIVYESPTSPDCPDSGFPGTENQTGRYLDVRLDPLEPNSGFPCSENQGIEEVPTDEVPTGRAPARPRSSIPADWTISEEMFAWAREELPGLDAVAVSRKFLDHYRGNGETRVDWLATWRNFLRREESFR